MLTVAHVLFGVVLVISHVAVAVAVALFPIVKKIIRAVFVGVVAVAKAEYELATGAQEPATAAGKP